MARKNSKKSSDTELLSPYQRCFQNAKKNVCRHVPSETMSIDNNTDDDITTIKPF